ncbi:uncharacterized protein MONBRDRAFT_8342 [Monosiga brevicollis MX1]|uniref:Uncharacterized protein n=1 Tax=Monosiga brevicollis TaxID=81824 RepID=A9UZS5_MONBE|nr:uncharacterized protein MONBRDRAFT_8342 [Monosiga brevicollis MX1]EDQ89284.1 predicted protein [Monosiga brevicollis MX1]|eukprot:XP_001745860.1 hypothetical protein [Monosiga brevicollis MX1]
MASFDAAIRWGVVVLVLCATKFEPLIAADSDCRMYQSFNPEQQRCVCNAGFEALADNSGCRLPHLIASPGALMREPRSRVADVVLQGRDVLFSVINSTTNTLTLLSASNLAAQLTEVRQGHAQTYTQAQLDQLLAAKANENGVYSKAAIDERMDAKADASAVYSKSDVDQRLANKASAIDLTQLTSTVEVGPGHAGSSLASVTGCRYFDDSPRSADSSAVPWVFLKMTGIVAAFATDLLRYTSAANIVKNGDFVNGLDAGQYNSVESRGNMSIVDISSWSTRPDALTHALRFDPYSTTTSGFGASSEYELHFSNEGNVTTLCAGTYLLSLWAYVSPDFDGWEQLLHSRWHYPESGQKTTDAIGPQSGGWPTVRGEWQHLPFRWYLGYPMRHTRGYVLATGLDLRRLGPGVCDSATNANDILTRVDDVEARLQGQINATTTSVGSLNVRVTDLEDQLQNQLLFHEYMDTDALKDGGRSKWENISRSSSVGRITVVPLDEPTQLGTSYAYKFATSGSRAITKLEVCCVVTPGRHRQRLGLSHEHDYEVSASVWYSPDYDGSQQVLHGTFSSTHDTDGRILNVWAEGASSGYFLVSDLSLRRLGSVTATTCVRRRREEDSGARIQLETGPMTERSELTAAREEQQRLEGCHSSKPRPIAHRYNIHLSDVSFNPADAAAILYNLDCRMLTSASLYGHDIVCNWTRPAYLTQPSADSDACQWNTLLIPQPQTDVLAGLHWLHLVDGARGSLITSAAKAMITAGLPHIVVDPNVTSVAVCNFDDSLTNALPPRPCLFLNMSYEVWFACNDTTLAPNPWNDPITAWLEGPSLPTAAHPYFVENGATLLHRSNRALGASQALAPGPRRYWTTIPALTPVSPILNLHARITPNAATIAAHLQPWTLTVYELVLRQCDAQGICKPVETRVFRPTAASSDTTQIHEQSFQGLTSGTSYTATMAPSTPIIANVTAGPNDLFLVLQVETGLVKVVVPDLKSSTCYNISVHLGNSAGRSGRASSKYCTTFALSPVVQARSVLQQSLDGDWLLAFEVAINGQTTTNFDVGIAIPSSPTQARLLIPGPHNKSGFPLAKASDTNLRTALPATSSTPSIHSDTHLRASSTFFPVASTKVAGGTVESTATTSSHEHLPAWVIPVVVTLGTLVVCLALVIMALVRRLASDNEDLERLLQDSIEKGVAVWLDRFELDRSQLVLGDVLGAGAYGTVVRARAYNIHEQLPEIASVAVKLFEPERSHMAPAALAYRAEASALKAISNPGHPNVIKLLGVSSTTMPLMIVTEYAPLGDVGSYLRSSGFKVTNNDLLTWCDHLLAALRYIHERQVVHADISARNCLLMGDQRLVLADFGLSRKLDAMTNYYINEKSDFLPYRWMAPESLRDYRFSPASDIFSLGVTMYEFWTFGRLPYTGWSNDMVRLRVMEGYRLPMPKTMDPRVQQLVSLCLATDSARTVRPRRSDSQQAASDVSSTSNYARVVRRGSMSPLSSPSFSAMRNTRPRRETAMIPSTPGTPGTPGTPANLGAFADRRKQILDDAARQTADFERTLEASTKALNQIRGINDRQQRTIIAQSQDASPDTSLDGMPRTTLELNTDLARFHPETPDEAEEGPVLYRHSTDSLLHPADDPLYSRTPTFRISEASASPQDTSLNDLLNESLNDAHSSTVTTTADIAADEADFLQAAQQTLASHDPSDFGETPDLDLDLDLHNASTDTFAGAAQRDKVVIDFDALEHEPLPHQEKNGYEDLPTRVDQNRPSPRRSSSSHSNPDTGERHRASDTSSAESRRGSRQSSRRRSMTYQDSQSEYEDPVFLRKYRAPGIQGIKEESEQEASAAYYGRPRRFGSEAQTDSFDFDEDDDDYADPQLVFRARADTSVEGEDDSDVDNENNANGRATTRQPRRASLPQATSERRPSSAPGHMRRRLYSSGGHDPISPLQHPSSLFSSLSVSLDTDRETGDAFSRDVAKTTDAAAPEDATAPSGDTPPFRPRTFSQDGRDRAKAFARRYIGGSIETTFSGSDSIESSLGPNMSPLLNAREPRVFFTDSNSNTASPNNVSGNKSQIESHAAAHELTGQRKHSRRASPRRGDSLNHDDDGCSAHSGKHPITAQALLEQLESRRVRTSSEVTSSSKRGSTLSQRPLDIQSSTAASFVSRQLMKYLVSRKDDEVGESTCEAREGVVLFADASGFTRLTNALTDDKTLGSKKGAEELCRILNNFFSKLIEITDRYGGDVIKFSGDAVTVVWFVEPEDVKRNLPATTLKQIALRACACACEIHKKLNNYIAATRSGIREMRRRFRHRNHKSIDSKSQRPDYQYKLQLHMGVGVGKLVAVHVGGIFKRWEYLIGGNPMTQIGNAEPLAQPGETCLSPQVAELLSGEVEALPLSSLTATEQEMRDLTPEKLEKIGDYVILQRLLRDIRPPSTCALSQGNPSSTILSNTKMQELIRRYIPNAVHQSIQEGRAFTAEMRHVSVVFANVQGIRLDVEDQATVEKVRKLVQDMMLETQRSLYQSEGSINKVMVDDKGLSILCAMGLPPMPHADDPKRALVAALDLVENIEALGSFIRCRVGVTTGMAFCGVIGAKQRSGVLCDADTTKKCKEDYPGTFSFRPSSEALLLKGFKTPVSAYYVGFNTRDSYTEKQKNRELQDYAGRELEAKELKLRLSNLNTTKGGTMVLTGERGSGKSQLVKEIETWADKRGFNVLFIPKGSARKQIPYPFADGVHTEAPGVKVSKSEDAKAGINWLVDIFLSREDELVALPMLGHVLPNLNPELELAAQKALLELRQETGAERDDSPDSWTVPRLRRRSDVSQVDLFRRTLHKTGSDVKRNVDPESWELAARLSDHCRNERSLLDNVKPLVMVSYHRCFLKRSVAQELTLVMARDLLVRSNAAGAFQLEPLNEERRLSYAAFVLAKATSKTITDAALPPELVQLLNDRAGGNPKHIKEMIQELLKQHNVLQVMENGRIRVKGDLYKVPVPAKMRGIVRQEFDSMDEHHKVVLRVAAIFGQGFTDQMLQDALQNTAHNLSPADVEERLQELVAVRVLQQVPTTQYVFEVHPADLSDKCYTFTLRLLQEEIQALNTDTVSGAVESKIRFRMQKVAMAAKVIQRFFRATKLKLQSRKAGMGVMSFLSQYDDVQQRRKQLIHVDSDSDDETDSFHVLSHSSSYDKPAEEDGPITTLYAQHSDDGSSSPIISPPSSCDEASDDEGTESTGDKLLPVTGTITEPRSPLSAASPARIGNAALRPLQHRNIALFNASSSLSVGSSHDHDEGLAQPDLFCFMQEDQREPPVRRLVSGASAGGSMGAAAAAPSPSRSFQARIRQPDGSYRLEWVQRNTGRQLPPVQPFLRWEDCEFSSA